MLGLKLATDPRWVNIAEKSIEEILTDHAYCEQKAASQGISLIVNYSEYAEIVDTVTPIVTEEWSHFERVLQELKSRGLRLGKQRKDEYVNLLLKIQKKGGAKHERLVEELLTCAMIEARSCERFRLLSLYCTDEHLRQFYHEFMVSEAEHYRIFLDLAKIYLPEEKVKARWKEYLDAEAEIMQSLSLRGDRVH
ncbi:MAG: tRNA-(ms[2]io[6]A)-hydroxylase [Bacteroidia bacterium]|nr:tRNA-(ms[2]io[6]A)-hydroxylase [Bacteroidia bacterium]MDW8348191.1 tRNA-(ms[2]io[6]A)-hydroxylase [Bacteroidia bacterium]